MKETQNRKNYKAFISAAGIILAALVCMYAESSFHIHPYATGAYHRLWVLFLCFVLCGTILLFLLAYHLFVKPLTKKPSIVRTSTYIVGALALLYVFIMPPMSGADEIRHYLGAYRLSNTIMFQDAADPEGYVYVRKCDSQILLNDFPGIDDYYKLTNIYSTGETEPVAFTADRPVDCLFLAYLPGALGITLARLLGLPQIMLMLFGRLFNVVFFMIFFVLAMRRMPFGREALLFICALPMTLNQIASFSYDVYTLALCFYFTAYVLDLAFMRESVKVKDMVILTAVITLVSPVKVVYMLLALLMFMIPAAKFGSKKKYIISAACMAVCMVGFFLIQKLTKLAEYTLQTDPYLSYADTTVYPIGALLGNPLLVIKIFMNTLAVYGGRWYMDMLGARLGWQDVQIPEVVLLGFTILGIMCAVKPAGEPVYWGTKQRVICIVSAVLCSAAAMLALLLVYTPDGAQFIYGVQGRYFLPVLPLFMVCIRSGRLRRFDDGTDMIVFIIAVMDFLAAVYVIGGIMSRMGVTKMLGGN